MTSIKQQTHLNRSVVTFLMTLTILSLSACGGGKKIITSDDSADYKSAISLPPLTKPSRVVTSPDNTVAPSAIVATPIDDIVEQNRPLVSSPVTIQSQNSDLQVATEQASLESLSNSQGLDNAATTTVATTTVATTTVATVVSVELGHSRLEIIADFDPAWEFLSASLQRSDLTIFSRNKEAGRFSIGCTNIAKAPVVVKSGRWSFFNRDRLETLEYCALQAITKRGTTIVSVLNQEGKEVSGEYSNRVFSRILNN
jgi:uncharacterized lipoprotein